MPPPSTVAPPAAAAPSPPARDATGPRSPFARATARERVGLVLLFAVALVLRLWPIAHGDGANHLADTHVVRSALGMAKDKDLVPPVGKYSTYPNLLPYALLPIYGVQYAIGRASGAWAGPGEFGYRVMERPALVHVPARVLVALLGAATALVVWRLARDAGLGFGAWVAGWLIAAGLLHLHFSVQERPWAPLVFFVALSALFAGRYAAAGGRRDLVASGLAAGLAFATHQAGLLAAALPALGALAAPWSGVGAVPLVRRVRPLVLAAVVFAIVAVALGHPYLLVHGATATEQVAAGDALAEMEGTRVSVGGQGMLFAFSVRTFERLSLAFVGYDPVLVLLAVGGVVFALRRRALVPAMLFAGGWGAFFLFHYNDHVRYLLPLATLAPLSAGALADVLARRAVPRVVLGVLLLVPLVGAVRLGHLLRQEDTRTLAQRALTAAPPVEGIAVDVAGPELPLDLASLERLARWRPLGAREEHRRLLLEAGVEPVGGAGIGALPIDALFEFEIRKRASWPRRVHAAELARLGSGPTEILRALGLDEVLLTDRSPGDGEPPVLVAEGAALGALPKMPPLRVEAGPIAVFDPSRGAPARSARLPTEMDLAWRDIWQVERPGPRLERRRLAP